MADDAKPAALPSPQAQHLLDAQNLVKDFLDKADRLGKLIMLYQLRLEEPHTSTHTAVLELEIKRELKKT